MNNQEAFDLALAGMRQQQYAPSLSADGLGCLYRGPGGKKCAVGHMLPDSLAKGLDDNGALFDTSIACAVRTISAIAEFFKGVDTALLTQLQVAHDALRDAPDNKLGSEFEAAAGAIAARFNLRYSAPSDAVPV